MENVLTALVNNLAAILTALATLLGVYFAWRSSNSKIEAVHTLINSRMDQLLTSEKKISKAEGKIEERKENNESIS